MKADNLTYLINSIEELREKLHIYNYKIYIFEAPEEKKYHAEVNIDYQGKVVSLYYNKKWLEGATYDEIHRTAFHELKEIDYGEVKHYLKQFYSEELVQGIIHNLIRKDEELFYNVYLNKEL